MSKKRKFYIEYSRIVNGIEYPCEYTITGVRSKEEAEVKLKRMCSEAGGPDPVIKSITEI